MPPTDAPVHTLDAPNTAVDAALVCEDRVIRGVWGAPGAWESPGDAEPRPGCAGAGASVWGAWGAPGAPHVIG